MTDHIIDITYYPNVHQYTARAVYQYDKGWQLKISGLTTNKIIQVQYGIEGMAQTLNIDPEYRENCYIAKIPDVLLTQIKSIVAYVYVADMSLGQTVCYIRIPITPREKPADYTYTQEETAGYAQLLAQLTQATKEVEALDKELETLIDATATVTESANAATQAANDASQAANEAVAEFETIKQDVNSQISELEERLTELEENPPSALPEDWTPTIENIEGLSDALGNIVEVSSEEPQDKNTELWINPDSEELQIPQIDDVNVSAYDTYSSQKIEEKVTGLQKDIKTLANTISLLHTDAGVPDTSAKAASHELYATDAPMHVKLYGATYQDGSGNPSPNNVRPISGLNVAKVQVGSKNLFDISKVYASFLVDGKIRITKIGYGADIYSGTTNGLIDMTDDARGNLMRLCAGTYILTFNLTPDDSAITNKRLIVCEIGDDNKVKKSHDINSGSTFTLTKNTLVTLRRSTNGAVTISDIQIEIGSVATPYELYNANVITLPLLPDGETLYEDCTVENDVLSGRDKRIVLDGTQNIYDVSPLTNMVKILFAKIIPDCLKDSAVSARFVHLYSAHSDTEHIFVNNVNGDLTVFVPKDKLDSLDKVGATAYFAANPLPIFYRSLEYTHEKDLRVCKVERYRVEKFDLSKYASFGIYNNQTELKNGCCYFAKFSDDFANIKSVATMKCTHFNPYASVAGLAGVDVIGCYSQGKALYIGIKAERLTGYASFNADDSATWAAAFNAWLVANPVMVYNTLNTPEVYMTDFVELRKPVSLMPVTVTGSGETEISYAHDTKHYIDSQIAAVVALAMNG